MLLLDDRTAIASADEVRAVIPVYIPDPMARHPSETRELVEDPDRSMALIGGTWVSIFAGSREVRMKLFASAARGQAELGWGNDPAAREWVASAHECFDALGGAGSTREIPIPGAPRLRES